MRPGLPRPFPGHCARGCVSWQPGRPVAERDPLSGGHPSLLGPERREGGGRREAGPGPWGQHRSKGHWAGAGAGPVSAPRVYPEKEDLLSPGLPPQRAPLSDGWGQRALLVPGRHVPLWPGSQTGLLTLVETVCFLEASNMPGCSAKTRACWASSGWARPWFSPWQPPSHRPVPLRSRVAAPAGLVGASPSAASWPVVGRVGTSPGEGQRVPKARSTCGKAEARLGLGAAPTSSRLLELRAARPPCPCPRHGGAPTPTPVQTSARRPGTRPLCARLGTGAPGLAVSCSPSLGHRGPWPGHCSRRALGRPSP